MNKFLKHIRRMIYIYILNSITTICKNRYTMYWREWLKNKLWHLTRTSQLEANCSLTISANFVGVRRLEGISIRRLEKFWPSAKILPLFHSFSTVFLKINAKFYLHVKTFVDFHRIIIYMHNIKFTEWKIMAFSGGCSLEIIIK